MVVQYIVVYSQNADDHFDQHHTHHFLSHPLRYKPPAASIALSMQMIPLKLVGK